MCVCLELIVPQIYSIPKKMEKKFIGSIVEISTAKGLSYALVSHEHIRYGGLLRAFPKIWEERPNELSKIFCGKEVTSFFFPLRAAVTRKIVCIAGEVRVPADFEAFPKFKIGYPNPQTGKVDEWKIWDGENVYVPTPGDLKNIGDIPKRSIWSDLLWIEWIESEWK